MPEYYRDAGMALYLGDAITELRAMPAESVQMCVTSPPYWQQRDYGVAGQYGMEDTPAAFVANMVAVFAEVRRVLRSDGTCWLNLGDTVLAKQLQGIPWRVAFALQADGWWLRSDIIWAKNNSMPESVTDRPTKAHEYLFLLTKSSRYAYDADAIREPSSFDPRGDGLHNSYSPPGQEPHKGGLNTGVKHATPASHNGSTFHNGKTAVHQLSRASARQRADTGKRNKRSVWTVATAPYSDAHFATFPPKLIEPCILAGSKPGDVVLDPFVGSGTTCLVARQHGRRAIGIDINADYLDMAIRRNSQQVLWFQEAT